MTNFKVGQKVVCVKPYSSPPHQLELKPGIYTILRISECKCYTTIDVGTYANKPTRCPTCGKIDNGVFHKSERFRPLVYDSATTEILEKFKLTEEKADVEIKEYEHA